MVLKTPNINKIAQEGIRFTNFYCNNPICMPNRSTIFTGQYPSVHGVTTNGRNLPQGTFTFLDALRDSGNYHTASFGKIHLNYFGAPSGKFINPTKSQEFAQVRDFNRLTKFSPYFGLDEVQLVSGHGILCGHPDYIDWVKKKIEENDSLRRPLRIRVNDTDKAIQSKINLCIDTKQSFVNLQVLKHFLPEQLYSTSFVKEKTIEFLEKFANGHYNKQNFFTFCSFPDPHHPFSPPGKYFDMFKPEDVKLPNTFFDDHQNDSELNRKHYSELVNSEGTAKGIFPIPKNLTELEAKRVIAASYGMEKMIDDAIGEILQRLDTLGLSDNTIVIFTTDHGDLGGEHRFFFKGPFLYQGLIKIPFIIKVPSELQNKVCYSLASSVDIPETILDIAGFPIPGFMQGKSLMPLVKDPYAKINNELIIEMDDDYNDQKTRTVITDEWRLSIFKNHGELFNLKEDPDEMDNLWGEKSLLEIKNKLLLCLMRRETSIQYRSVERDCGY